MMRCEFCSDTCPDDMTRYKWVCRQVGGLVSPGEVSGTIYCHWDCAEKHNAEVLDIKCLNAGRTPAATGPKSGKGNKAMSKWEFWKRHLSGLVWFAAVDDNGKVWTWYGMMEWKTPNCWRKAKLMLGVISESFIPSNRLEVLLLTGTEGPNQKGE